MTSQLRWFCKKSARRAVAFGSTAVAAFKRPTDTSGIRVLTYHRFGHADRDPFCVSAANFENQLTYLAENGLALSLDELIAFVDGNETLDESKVLVTIDDGLSSVYSVALPLLRHFNIPAVAFVSPGLIDASANDRAAEAYIDWAQAEELSSANVVIGSHAMTHRSLGNLSLDEVEQELQCSKATIENRLGTTADSFAYPFGTLADFNRETAAMVERAGYRCAFTSQHGMVCDGSDCFELPRIKIEGGEGLAMFRRIVNGGLDAWRVVDKALWRLQAGGS